MNDAVHRIAAVVRADVLIRVRRPSSIAVFLVLCLLAYLLVPDLSTGRALMQVDGHRALYNSATIALATAGLASMLLGMLGFYLVSNTIRRDIVTRTGYVIAAMPVSNAEYLSGKFLGNVAFLGLVVLGYMVNVMAMHLLRGEVAIEPLVYIATYLAMTGPAVLVISALALLFECARPLSGRVGDVVYFFVWIAMVSLIAGAELQPGLQWPHFTDVLGLLFMLTQVRAGQTTDSVQIGQSQYDPSQAPWIFHGIQWNWFAVETRLAAAAFAIPLLLLAWVAFVRFNPAKIKSAAQHARQSPLAWLNRRLKPVTRLILPVVGGGSVAADRVPGLPGQYAGIVRADLALTFMLSPLALVWALVLGICAVVAPAQALHESVLPLIFVGIVIAVADIATRDAAAGTTALLYSMPAVRPTYVPAKFLTAMSTAMVFLLFPLGRLLLSDPAAALSLLIGGAFVAATAVSLGTLTGSPKTFTGLFLLFLYLVMSSKTSPGFDFAGWNASATGGTRIGYLLATTILVAAAMVKQRLASART